MLWIFAERFFMAALRQCEKSEGCFAVFTAQPWTAAVLFKLQFSDGLLEGIRDPETTASDLDCNTFYGRFRIDSRTGIQTGHCVLLIRWQGGYIRSAAFAI